MHKEQTTLSIKTGDTKMLAKLFLPPSCRDVILIFHTTTTQEKLSVKISNFFYHSGFTVLQAPLVQKGEKVFLMNPTLLTERVIEATKAIQQHPKTSYYDLHYLAIGEAGEYILRSAAIFSPSLRSITCYGTSFRTNLTDFEKIHTPILFIVGSKGFETIRANQAALDEIKAGSELMIIPNSSNNFVAKDAIKNITKSTLDWFKRHQKETIRIPA